MLLDGQHYPTRVRAAWVSDDDIATTAARHPAAPVKGDGQAVNPAAIAGDRDGLVANVDGALPVVALVKDSA